VYQLLPLNGIKSFANLWIEVCETLDGKTLLLYKDKGILYAIIERNERKKLKEEILNLREYKPEVNKKKYTPPPDHPWRKNMYRRKCDILNK